MLSIIFHSPVDSHAPLSAALCCQMPNGDVTSSCLLQIIISSFTWPEWEWSTVCVCVLFARMWEKKQPLSVHCTHVCLDGAETCLYLMHHNDDSTRDQQHPKGVKKAILQELHLPSGTFNENIFYSLPAFPLHSIQILGTDITSKYLLKYAHRLRGL